MRAPAASGARSVIVVAPTTKGWRTAPRDQHSLLHALGYASPPRQAQRIAHGFPTLRTFASVTDAVVSSGAHLASNVLLAPAAMQHNPRRLADIYTALTTMRAISSLDERTISLPSVVWIRSRHFLFSKERGVCDCRTGRRRQATSMVYVDLGR